ncbi:MOSC domain-containing protein [Corynebacterium pyruviciproducens]
MATVISCNRATPRTDPGGSARMSGMAKVPVSSLELFIPGPHYGDGSGVVGDFVGDTKHHGGAQKAVYAFAREELDWWEGEVGRELPNGAFGENLTTTGIAWEDAVVNTRFRIGSAVVEVSVSRTPCRTFAGWMGEPGWIKRFTAHGRTGSYLRVITPGTVHAGDELVVVDVPGHGVTMGEVFAGACGDKQAARRLVAARCLPAMYHERMVALLGG